MKWVSLIGLLENPNIITPWRPGEESNYRSNCIESEADVNLVVQIKLDDDFK